MNDYVHNVTVLVQPCVSGRLFVGGVNVGKLMIWRL